MKVYAVGRWVVWYSKVFTVRVYVNIEVHCVRGIFWRM